MHSFDRPTCVHYAEGECSGVVSVDSGADTDFEEAAACHGPGT